MSLVNSKEKVILDRIRHLEDAITKGREFLERGKHADWHGFRALFVDKVRDGNVLPPHKDWIKNVFLPRREEALRKAQKSLERLASDGKRQTNQSAAGKAGIASRAEIERHRPGMPEPDRSAKSARK